MATTTSSKNILQAASSLKISGFRRYILLRSHPLAIFWDVATGIWIVYFLWLHAWEVSLLLLVIERGFCWIALQRVNAEALGKTILGKLALLHLEPLNLIVQILGVGLLGWGIWMHETISILAGASIVLMGHTVGWGKVHDSLKWKN